MSYLPEGFVALLDQLDFVTPDQKLELARLARNHGPDRALGPVLGRAVAMGVENAFGEFRRRLEALEGASGVRSPVVNLYPGMPEKSGGD